MIGDALPTRCHFDDGEMPFVSVDICGYMDSDGEIGYAYNIVGDRNKAQIIGLLEMVKTAIMGSFESPADED